MLFRFIAVFVLLAGAAGCSDIPTAPTEEDPGPPEFASQVTPGGTASRGISLPRGGTIEVTLTSAVPSSALGLGVGIPRAGGGCSLSQSIITTPGPAPHLSVAADPGEFCVQVYDPGTLIQPVAFAVTITVH